MTLHSDDPPEMTTPSSKIECVFSYPKKLLSSDVKLFSIRTNNLLPFFSLTHFLLHFQVWCSFSMSLLPFIGQRCGTFAQSAGFSAGFLNLTVLTVPSLKW